MPCNLSSTILDNILGVILNRGEADVYYAFRAIAVFALTAFLGAVLATCGTPAVSDKPLVLTTTTLFADMAANVAGDRVRVESIGPGGGGRVDRPGGRARGGVRAEARGLEARRASRALLRERPRSRQVGGSAAA